MLDAMNGRLLLVIPPVVRILNGEYEVETDFSHNLRIYLKNFSHVTFACPVFPPGRERGVIVRSLRIDKLPDADRLSFIRLPYAYREDRYLRYWLGAKRLLRSEIAKAQYLIFSPHAKYDWSTLATLEAIKMGRKYDMESDHDHASAQQFALSTMPLGIKKLRKKIWAYSFLKTVDKCFSHSSLALLQGQDVFDAHKDIAPNPHKVLNVQVSSQDHISIEALKDKLARLKERKSISVVYAGQAIPRKGPLDWIEVVHAAVERGADIEATWFGDGLLLPEMKQKAEALGIADKIAFAGSIPRDEIIARLQKAEIFLFCHKTGESPRCLGEALAAGCSFVGYGTAYSRDLVASRGGGLFADMDQWKSLAEIIVELDKDRTKLERLVEQAAASGRLLDRDSAMQQRVDLIKKYLAP